jgi:ABC-type transporter Mla maintaining outer membrane lipid asymmetry ATPase subunit MlaF
MYRRTSLADEGEIKVFGHDIVNLDSNKLNEIRIRIGFYFKMQHLRFNDR